MNDPHLSEHQLLTALKQEDSPSDADRERIRARVWTAVGTGALGAGGAALTHKAASAAPKSVFALGPAAKLGFVLAVVGSGAVFASRQGSKDSHTADVAGVVGLASTPVLAQSVDPLPVEPQGIAEVSSQAQGPVAPPDAPLQKNSRPLNSPSSAKSLDAEISLLRAAQQALQAGHYAEALGKLNEHAQRFPRGVLRHEREASRSIAQCQSGQLSAGQSRARTYLRASADSPMAARVRAACQFD